MHVNEHFVIWNTPRQQLTQLYDWVRARLAGLNYGVNYTIDAEPYISTAALPGTFVSVQE